MTPVASTAPAQARRFARGAARAWLFTLLLVGGCTSPTAGTANPASPAPSAAPDSAAHPSPMAARSAEPRPSPAASGASPISLVDILAIERSADGGPRNIVQVHNEQDGRFDARGRVRVERIDAPTVAPLNRAEAQGSCTDCQTIAVAVQMSVYRRSVARTVAPQNAAIALNVRCTRCVTVARAIQYVIPVDDPDDLPRDVDALARQMDRELRYFQTVHSLSEIDPAQARARLNAVIQQFQELVQYLNDVQDEKDDDDADADRHGTPGPLSPTPATPAPAQSTPRAAATATTPSPSAATPTAPPASATPTATALAVATQTR